MTRLSKTRKKEQLLSAIDNISAHSCNICSQIAKRQQVVPLNSLKVGTVDTAETKDQAEDEKENRKSGDTRKNQAKKSERNSRVRTPQGNVDSSHSQTKDAKVFLERKHATSIPQENSIGSRDHSLGTFSSSSGSSSLVSEVAICLDSISKGELHKVFDFLKLRGKILEECSCSQARHLLDLVYSDILYEACCVRNLDVAKGLINAASAPRDVANGVESNRRVLVAAASSGRVDLVQHLIRVGANAAIDEGEALVRACEEGHVDIVKLLIQSGANGGCQNGVSLVLACQESHAEVVQFLLESRKFQAKIMNRALIVSCQEGHVDVVKLLLDSGVDPRCDRGAPLSVACQEGRYDTVVELLRRENVDVQSNDNMALIMACKNGHYKVVDLLLLKGADVHARNKLCLQVAEENGHRDVLALLEMRIVDLEINGRAKRRVKSVTRRSTTKGKESSAAPSFLKKSFNSIRRGSVF